MFERYAHLVPDHLAKAANRLDVLLGGYYLARSETGISASSRLSCKQLKEVTKWLRSLSSLTFTTGDASLNTLARIARYGLKRCTVTVSPISKDVRSSPTSSGPL